MPLVTPLSEDDDPDLVEFAALLGATLGGIPNSLRTLRRRPAVARAVVALNEAAMACDGRVTPALKRLIGHLASHAAGCRYCQAHTLLAAERLGTDAARLAAIWDYQASPLFTDAERAAFDVAIAAARVPNAVTPELADALRAHWDDGEIVEIIAVVALYGFLNRWNDSMGTTLEDHGREAASRILGPRGWDAGKHR